jgi:hypothetical protein
VGN